MFSIRVKLFGTGLKASPVTGLNLWVAWVVNFFKNDVIEGVQEQINRKGACTFVDLSINLASLLFAGKGVHVDRHKLLESVERILTFKKNVLILFF